MKHNLFRKRLDIIVSGFLLLLTVLSILFRSSPVDFMNPGFPILRADDLKLSEKFILLSQADPLRLTGIHDFNKVTYETVFDIEDISQVFTDMNKKIWNETYVGFQTLTEYSNADEAKALLLDSYEEYIGNLDNSPIAVTDIHLADFSIEADRYLLWCEQYSREPIFDAEKVGTCYYWTVNGPYQSKIRLFMSRGGEGSRFSLELFSEIITRAESKILSKIKTQK